MFDEHSAAEAEAVRQRMAPKPRIYRFLQEWNPKGPLEDKNRHRRTADVGLGT